MQPVDIAVMSLLRLHTYTVIRCDMPNSFVCLNNCFHLWKFDLGIDLYRMDIVLVCTRIYENDYITICYFTSY